MTAGESAGDALFRDPLPAGFSRRVLRVAPGHELDFEASCVPDAIVVVEEGVAELECRSGTRRRFGRGSMIPIARLPNSPPAQRRPRPTRPRRRLASVAAGDR